MYPSYRMYANRGQIPDVEVQQKIQNYMLKFDHLKTQVLATAAVSIQLYAQIVIGFRSVWTVRHQQLEEANALWEI